MGMNKMLEHIFEKFYAEFIMVNVGDYFETLKLLFISKTIITYDA